jgi:hypothetical protein
MPCKIKNPSNINLDSLEPHVQGMYDYFDQKLGFKKPPTMFFDSDPSNQSNVLGKTAYYDPSALEVHVFVDGRHPKDMLRSIAHELIHHQQNLEGRLDVGGYMGEGYYLKNEEMKKLEQEAMLRGNALMREYEDNLKLEEKNKMSLKEWKNNELNQLLLKKFGILKEEKNIKMVKKDEVPEGAEVVVPDGPGDLVGIKKEELSEEKECPKCKDKPCKCEDKEDLDEAVSVRDEDIKTNRMQGREGSQTQPDRIHEEDLEEGSCGDKKYMKEEDLEEGGGRMAPDRKHESKARKLKEALEIIAKTNKTILNSIKTKK